ncbi:MAG: potassium channel family protein [Acidimicrobiales bacterium]
MDLVGVVSVLIGVVVVAWMLADSFQTLLATNLRTGRLSFTRGYYTVVWKSFRALCARVRDDQRRDRLLSLFGPASFMGLLVAWVVVEIAGWAMIWWGLRGGFEPPITAFSDAWYYSGVVYFSIGFGDILPTAGGLRLLTVVEGLSGLGTLGLVIGFLPSLNAAYSARERRLLLLDDLSDQRITPISLVRSQIGPDQDIARLEQMFDEWAEWCADVYDSHTTFPMLMWFRSKHRGHSWITGLGVVTDAAIAFAGTVPSAEHGPAERLYRQSVRLVQGLARRVELEPQEGAGRLSARWWSVGYSSMQTIGVPMRDFDDSFRRVTELRREFHPYMEAFIDELMAPRGFWGVTAADHLAEADLTNLFFDED